MTDDEFDTMCVIEYMVFANLKAIQNEEEFEGSSSKVESSLCKYYGHMTIIGGICIHLFCGNLYLWGNISNYVISHFHYLGDENANLKIAVAVLPFSFTV